MPYYFETSPAEVGDPRFCVDGYDVNSVDALMPWLEGFCKKSGARIDFWDPYDFGGEDVIKEFIACLCSAKCHFERGPETWSQLSYWSQVQDDGTVAPIYNNTSRESVIRVIEGFIEVAEFALANERMLTIYAY